MITVFLSIFILLALVYMIRGQRLIHLKLHFLTRQNIDILMTQEELAKGLADVSAQVAKIGEESKVTLQKVSDLEAALANQDNVTPAVQAAFDALKAQVQTVDDLVPDVPVQAPTPAPSGDQPAA